MRLQTRVLIAGLAVALFGALSAAALATSPHFKKGGEPVCNVSGAGTNSSSTTCSASLSGLGGGDLTISVTVSGSAVYQCQNGGGNTAPGQNRVMVGPSTTPTTIPGSAVKNGNVSFTTNPAVLSAPATVSGSAAGCPNAHWTGVNPALTTTNITMSIAQGGVTLFTCTASNPEGLSGTVPLSC
ncbi:MAG: hypothetical protein ACTHNB_12930 [Gaiellaceae bacterium]